MKSYLIRKPVITLLPVLGIIPVVIQLLHGLHIGGLNTLSNFFLSAFQPSLEKSVLISSWHGIQVTFGIGLISWSISLSIGLILGIATSYTFNSIVEIPEIIPTSLRRILTIPRATHELIWGLLLLQIFGLAPWIAILAIAVPYSSLMARVFSEQIDKINSKTLTAINQTGCSKFSILSTALFPKIIPIIGTYGFYRLECAIRGATLLGVFGLGGIGTELQLSIMSLQFNEVWSSMWMLVIAIFLLEKTCRWLQNPELYVRNIGMYSIGISLLIILSSAISLICLDKLGVEIFSASRYHSFNFPSIIHLKSALINLPWFKLIIETISLTLIASLVATGVPPLLLMLGPSKIAQSLISFIWIFFRIIPPPLTSMLLLLSTTPTISVAALALAIQNMAVLGRLLKDRIDQSDDRYLNSIKATGANDHISWFYGKLSSESTNYLTYALYRSDVILRESIVVGMAGGTGLGWQLKESISSFAWEEVMLITIVFIIITLIGETVSERLQKRLLYDEHKEMHLIS
ncbi:MULTISPECIES: PhnE/PtxC family ABC transporter permease [unclassified Prochlorococcus]|uniref:PhnE/PtxC family ABC transporter permease n=1 Tax=unclassified Prochlorococcus TaxID=2627481 RepID=UPI00053377D8|nr:MULTISPECIES: ABC transporter permease subunit [unclassified Prochlorococcus]KGG17624.1 Phosphonate ABC transporter permease protein phnE [Prochlorococcus sp. MIT 0603]